ncbi:MAG: hypothetical protein RR902_03465, partial [Oscillospiraceae bacterium]
MPSKQFFKSPREMQPAADFGRGHFAFIIKKVAVILFWLLVWQIASLLVKSELLLASPLVTVKTLVTLLGEGAFWGCVLASFLRITFGFLSAVLVGVILAGLSYAFTLIDALLKPLFSVMKTVPVASFIILALVWVTGK